MNISTDQIRAAVPYGRANAVSRAGLAAELGVSDREMRRGIELARNEGAIILCDQDGRGYYQSNDLADISRQYRQDTNRALAILKRRKHMRALLKAAGREV